RATLRGCAKLTKRHMVAAMTYNLSLLMRALFGIGTPKQAMAASHARLLAACRWLSGLVRHLLGRIASLEEVIRTFLGSSHAIRRRPRFARFSTGCYYGDNLDILTRYIADESVDLVYLDPVLDSVFANHPCRSLSLRLAS
ncbi:MAG: hypothetical protein ABI318_15705, partial [Chthoniobacteraceae bacterium]